MLAEKECGRNQGHQLEACCNSGLGDVSRNRKKLESLEAMKTDIRKRKEYSTYTLLPEQYFTAKTGMEVGRNLLTASKFRNP